MKSTITMIQHGLLKVDDKQLHNFMSKKVLCKEAAASILNMEGRGEEAKAALIENQINGEINLWAPMSKVKFFNWDDLCRTTRLKTKTKEFQMRSTTSLFSRLMMIARSERNNDLQAAISQHEFHSVSHLLMNPDGTLLTSKKSDLVKALMDIVLQTPVPSPPSSGTVLVIDGMAVVQALVHAVTFRSCADLGKAFPTNIDALLKDYDGGRVIFDNYTKVLPMKESICYCGAQKASGEDMYIDDATPIRDTKKMLASSTTKDHLTLFLAQKAIALCKKPVVTATRQDVLTNHPQFQPRAHSGPCTQEEADTLRFYMVSRWWNQE